MLYNVSQLMREPVGSTRTDQIDADIDIPAGSDHPTRVTGRVDLIRTLSGVLARAGLSTDLTEMCSRCLQPATVPLQLAVEEEFIPTVDAVTGGPLPEPAEPTPFRIDEFHHLDLAEAVRQAALLEQPMAPLCRPDCRGLCPNCGADLNAGPCKCPAEPVDDRWAALRALKRET